MPHIYHVTTKQEWEAARDKGYYTTSSLETEGFIHCSEQQQIRGVLERYFQGKADLLTLVIDREKLKPQLKYELSPFVNETFPHVYGPINLDAVVEAYEI